MKKFSGFGNSPMKNDGKLLKKKKDLKTDKNTTPKRNDGFNILPVLPEDGSKPSSVDRGFNLLPGFTDGNRGKKKKTSTGEKLFKN